ncbi:hypothetical protein SDC9_165129 [bioreactor metagenome]|uniref:Uncharacterized protein n=1 Tax=bioreactor metagenome TaxID=1076179 RepID=A0A645G0W4_9ZZZZ
MLPTISVMLSERIIDVRDMHSQNAEYPIDVTLLGMTIEVRDTQP